MYCVRPNSGRVAPGTSVEVHVLLQPMKEDPPADFKCKDKFLVQAVKVEDSLMSLPEGSDALSKEVAELWSYAEARKKTDAPWARDNFSERKLKVAFLPSDPSKPHPPPSPTGSKTPSVTYTDNNSNYLAVTPSTGMAGAKASVTPLDAADEAIELEKALARINKLEKELAKSSGGKEVQVQTVVKKQGVNWVVAVLVALLAFILGAIFF
jgi:hypothetical protein